MSKDKQHKKVDTALQSKNGAQNVQTPSAAPVFNGELPHSTKKVSLGPNTKR